MQRGKLSSEQLSSIVLGKFRAPRPEVLLGPGVGEDCAAVTGGDVTVVTTDPITAGKVNLGFLAIHVNANDIASAGASPFACLVTLLVPTDETLEHIENTVAEVAETAASLDIDVIGGHTEITDAVSRTVVSVTMLGRPVVPGKLITSAGLQPGDTLIMTKYAGIEGTLLLADEHRDELTSFLSEADKSQLDLLRSFMSVIPEGRIAAADPFVRAMHDITEGGVVGAVQEMCMASGVGAVLDLGKIPVLPVTRHICDFYDVNPERLISSGSLLVGVDDQTTLMQDLGEAGIAATVIGYVEDGKDVRDSETGDILEMRASDDIYRQDERRKLQGGKR